MKNKMKSIVLGGVIAFGSVVVGTMTILPAHRSVEPHFTVLYKDPAGAWPGQNSHGNAKSGYVDARPAPLHRDEVTRIWDI